MTLLLEVGCELLIALFSAQASSGGMEGRDEYRQDSGADVVPGRHFHGLSLVKYEYFFITK